MPWLGTQPDSWQVNQVVGEANQSHPKSSGALSPGAQQRERACSHAVQSMKAVEGHRESEEKERQLPF